MLKCDSWVGLRFGSLRPRRRGPDVALRGRERFDREREAHDTALWRTIDVRLTTLVERLERQLTDADQQRTALHALEEPHDALEIALAADRQANRPHSRRQRVDASLFSA